MNSRKTGMIAVFFCVLGFIAGGLTKQEWNIMGQVVQGAEFSLLQDKENVSVLPVTFFDDAGRKVCVRSDAKLEVSHSMKIEIPVEKWQCGQTGEVEIRVRFTDGTEKMSRITILRKALHNELK